MSMLFAYMTSGEGVGVDVRGFKNFCQRRVRIFSTCFVYVCVREGGQVQYLSFLKKIIDPLLFINDLSL